MHVQGGFLFFLLMVLLQIGQEVLASDSGYKIVIKAQPKKSLFCFRCYEYEDHCLDMKNLSNIEHRRCEDDENFCQIRRLEKRDKLVLFERGCTRECTPGCQTALYRTQCVQCCNRSYCNIMSAAEKLTLNWIVTALSGVAAVIMNRI